jgi:hypothetical protein
MGEPYVVLAGNGMVVMIEKVSSWAKDADLLATVVVKTVGLRDDPARTRPHQQHGIICRHGQGPSRNHSSECLRFIFYDTVLHNAVASRNGIVLHKVDMH